MYQDNGIFFKLNHVMYFSVSDLEVGKYCAMRFITKIYFSTKIYIVQIFSIHGNEIKFSFIRRLSGFHKVDYKYCIFLLNIADYS